MTDGGAAGFGEGAQALAVGIVHRWDHGHSSCLRCVAGTSLPFFSSYLFFFSFCFVISYELLVLGLKYGSRGFRNVLVLLYN